ncbi:MAG TPA: Trm112 family protein [Terriglobales bacterium]|nr:Trm112 family protein [Terriglobales bacterium]
MLSEDLLAIIRCPECRKELVYNQQAQNLKCSACGLVYPIRDGFPVLLKDQASRE